MLIQKSELDPATITQQTWKRTRTVEEINNFLSRREAVLEGLTSDELNTAYVA